jgi:ABC-type dipeptide/oligopeptide/nickel transport system permease subunit
MSDVAVGTLRLPQVRGFSSAVVGRLRKDRLAFAGLIIILIISVASVLAPIVAPHDPVEMRPVERYAPPSPAHPLGTDFFGRDILSRLMYGGRVSLLIGLATVAINGALGLPLGLLAGYLGGRVDTVIMRVADTLIVFPTLIFAMALMAVRGVGLLELIIALTFKGWTPLARLVRSEALAIREREFVQAARAIGASHARIIVRHVLPNSLSAFIVYATLGITTPILAEAALSFLGLGIQPPAISWGQMISQERNYMQLVWWPVTFPGIVIALTVLGFNLLGDGLRDALDPRLR